MHEYHDDERDRVRHASRAQQEEYYRLRGNVVAAVNRNLVAITQRELEVAVAVEDLETFLAKPRHRARMFRVSRPEDSTEDHYPGERVWLR